MLSLEDIQSLHQAIGLVVVTPRPDGSLSIEGGTPDWLRNLGGGELNDPEHAMAPFLETFLLEARAFWAERRDGRLRSGLVTLPDGEGDVHFEISALTIHSRDMLVFERRTHDDSDKQQVLQKAREGFLLYKQSIETTASLTAAKAEAEAVGQAAAATLGNWCEEMRRPVNAVTGAVDVLTEHELTPAQIEMVDVIRRNTQVLLELIDNAIDFSKAHQGH